MAIFVKTEKSLSKLRGERIMSSQEDEKREFMDRYGDEILRFFEEYPEVKSWSYHQGGFVTVVLERRGRLFPVKGSFVFDEKDVPIKWVGENSTREFVRTCPSLQEEMRISQLALMLKDNENLSKYCENVASSLLEEDHCIFNVPYGLRVKAEEYEDRYGSADWEAAWAKTLKNEFQAEKVVAKGKGLFMLEAI